MIDRLICNGYIREIGNYLSLADIYASPNRTGGGVGMALAVYGGTPVLSFHSNDACNFLIDDMAQETAMAYKAQLETQIAKPAYLQKIIRDQRSRFEQDHMVDASADDLEKHSRAARNEWSRG